MNAASEDKSPVGRNLPLEHSATIPVLGIPVTFETNEPALLEIAEQAFGAWRVLERSPRLIAETRVRYRIQVEESDDAPRGEHARVTYRLPDKLRILVQATGTIGIADVARREALLYTTRAIARDRQHFRYNLLEALTLGILTKLDRQPLHAACIARGETGLLLAGPSGAGKSTLTFAAARKGYTVMADDHVNIQLEPRLRIWGMPGFLHLPPEAAGQFPELTDLTPTLLANGKRKIAINLAAMDAVPELPVVQRAGICVLERGHGEPSLETLEPRTLMEALTRQLDPGFDEFADTIGECVRLIASHGGWRLRTGPNPFKTLEKVESIFEMLAGAKT